MFTRLVAIAPVNLPPVWEEKLAEYAKELRFYRDEPQNDEEMIARIGDADGILLGYTTKVSRKVLESCPNLQYVGLCCSLYSPEASNVDLAAAEERGITVRGVMDYGDEGVPEYVISELVRYLHGFGGASWKTQPQELSGVPVGVLGMGTTGQLVAAALAHFGARVYYHCRSPKPDVEAAHGYQYLPLPELLGKVDILCGCLNKNAILMHDEQFAQFGNGKIMMNTSIGPMHDVPALEKWLANPTNAMFCDIPEGIDPSGRLLALPNVFCVGQSSGLTERARNRLGEKVRDNILAFFEARDGGV